MTISADILNSYEYPEINIDDLLAQEIEKDDHVFVVLDDDPTGVQTVHDVNVYTDWQTDTLINAFREDRLFFMHTKTLLNCLRFQNTTLSGLIWRLFKELM